LNSWQLSEAELDLRGRHPTLGEVTLRELLATWVVHDLGHIAQVSRVMAKHYKGDVGPWTRFLPVLSDRTGQEILLERCFHLVSTEVRHHFLSVDQSIRPRYRRALSS